MRSHRARLLPFGPPLVAVCLLALGVPPRAHADPAREAPACNDQRPQPFLVRGNYAYRSTASVEERHARTRLHEQAIRYRTERYGYVPGVGRPEWNPMPAIAFAEHVTFLGLHVAINRRVTPALRCAEREVQTTCTAAYRPQYLSGYRSSNSFYDGEVSNHRFGIALDVDPERNLCCKCLGPSALHPICARPSATVADRMVMPSCWVTALERFGFYWYGHDELEDTMHFEFLGDPDAIVRARP